MSNNPIYDKLTPQRKQLVDVILKNLEQHKRLWKQGWMNTRVPISISGHKYKGVNHLYLYLIAQGRNYEDNRWVTYKQMEKRGWHFKTDEEGKSLGKKSGVSVEYFEFRDKATKKPFDRAILNGMSSEEKSEYIQENVYPLRKYYVVFNGDLIDGIPKLEKHELNQNEQVERAEKILRYWNENESKIIYGGSQAYYIPSSDEIHLPERNEFYSMQEFYSTALHEIGHSTGHEKRLNRDLSGAFGSESYAQEELRAELASMFIEQDLEISVEENHIQNNFAYIKSWHDAIKENPNALFTAIADAEKIAKFVMSKEKIKNKEENELLKEENEIEELPSEIYFPPSVIAKNVKDSFIQEKQPLFSNMEDMEVFEKASTSKRGTYFHDLYCGKKRYHNPIHNEQSLMNHLAIYSKDKEQLLRIFQTSSQFNENKPMSEYEEMANQSIQFVEEMKTKSVEVLPQEKNQKGHVNVHAKR